MTTTLFDFQDPAAARIWHPIDDRVMGGRSQSRLRHDPAGHAVFEGVVSLAQGGGFASVRSQAGDRGLAGATVCLVEVRGMQAREGTHSTVASGRSYKLTLLTDDAFDSLSYQADFAPASPGWQTLSLPLADFRARFRGRDIPGAPPLDASRIRQVGLMTAGREAGPFALALRRIALA